MKKRVNKNLPLVGFRENIERDDATQNVTFETDGSVDTRPGLKEVILPEDPRYILAKVNDIPSGNMAGLSGLIPDEDKPDQYLWTWEFVPDGGAGGGTGTGGTGTGGTGTLVGRDTGGTVVVSTPAVVNESDIVFNPTLPAATRGSSYSVDLMQYVSGGTPPYKIYAQGRDSVTIGGTDVFENFFFGVTGSPLKLPELPGIGFVNELPNILTTTSFQWVWNKYTLALVIQDSSSPKKTLMWQGEIPVTVNMPVISGLDTFDTIDLGTIAVGVPFTHTFSTGTTGQGNKAWTWAQHNALGGATIPHLPGLTLNLTTGVLSGTLTSETGYGSSDLWVYDLYLGAGTYDGAFLDDMAHIVWKTTNYNPPVLEIERSALRIISGTEPCGALVTTSFPIPTIRAGTGTAPFVWVYNPTPFEFDGWIGYGSVTVTDALGLSTTLSFRCIRGFDMPCPASTAGPGFFNPPIGGPIEPGTLVSGGAIPGALDPGTGPIDPGNYAPVGPNPPTISSSPVITATEGVAYSYAPLGSGGTFSAILIPSWLTFSGGVLAGTPAVGNIGNSAVVLQISGPGGTLRQSFNIVVSSASGGDPAFTSTPITVATTGVPYTYSITTSGTHAPWTITCPTKPVVMTFLDNGDGTATLNGTFAITGVNPVQLKVVDSVAGEAYQNFNITVS